jgi:hypothetical protein
MIGFRDEQLVKIPLRKSDGRAHKASRPQLKSYLKGVGFQSYIFLTEADKG